MLNKPTKCQLVWLLFGVLSTVCSTLSGCNTTLTIDVNSGKIPIPSNSSYCLWKIELSTRPTQNLLFELELDFSLEDCEKCKCEYIEIWDKDWSKDPKHSIGRFCGEVKRHIISITEKRVLIEYSSSKMGSKDSQRFMRYGWIAVDHDLFTRAPKTDHDDNDHHDGDDHHHHRHDRDDKGSAITTTAIGILLSLVFLIGALACGICLVQFTRPKRRRRQRQPSVLQTPVTSGLPKLPHLPNYFENDSALPPPYLDTIGDDGNPVPTPACYDNPPAYSILDTESTLETTGDTRASDLINRRL